MIHSIQEKGDAANFVSKVDAVLRGIVKMHAPPEIILVKISNWFGPKWLRFSGKVVGTLGVWHGRLTIPPFVPNRVVWQRRFTAPSYEEVSSGDPIHVETSGFWPLHRSADLVAPGKALVWFSGASEANGRAAIMGYIPGPDSYWVWYAAFSHNDTWRPNYVRGISASEFEVLMDSKD